jgi:hypothetical protein
MARSELSSAAKAHSGWGGHKRPPHRRFWPRDRTRKLPRLDTQPDVL